MEGEQGDEQGRGKEDSCQKRGKVAEQFLEAEEKPGPLDMKDSQPFRVKWGGGQQAAQEDDSGQQGVGAERGAVAAQMVPGQKSPADFKADNMVDIDPFHAVIRD